MLSFTAQERRWPQPRYFSVVSTDLCPERNWICSSSPPVAWHSRAQVRRRSCGANLSIPARLARCRTIHQTNFLLTFDPQTLPAQLTRRKIVPSSIPDALSHSSRTVFTHAGTGTVLIWPPFPKRLTIAQMFVTLLEVVNLSPVSSALRKPQPRRMERMARSLLSFVEALSGIERSFLLCDGGSCFWGVLYNVESGSFSNLQTNGSA